MGEEERRPAADLSECLWCVLTFKLTIFTAQYIIKNLSGCFAVFLVLI